MLSNKNLPARVYCCKLLKSPRLQSCVCAWFRDAEYKRKLFFVVSKFSCDIPKKKTIAEYRTWLAYLDLHHSCSKVLSSFSYNWNIQEIWAKCEIRDISTHRVALGRAHFSESGLPYLVHWHEYPFICKDRITFWYLKRGMEIARLGMF